MKEKAPKIEYELEPEEKAFVYQQISEFEPFFLPDSNVGVKVDKLTSESGDEEYRVTLVITGGGTFVQSLARRAS